VSPFRSPEGAAIVVIFFLYGVLLAATLRGRRLVRRLGREGVAGRSEVVGDRRVRFWIVLPVYVGALSFLVGAISGLALLADLFSTDRLPWTPSRIFQPMALAAAILAWGAAGALTGLVATWSLGSGAGES
jgi:hypothetical protein